MQQDELERLRAERDSLKQEVASLRREKLLSLRVLQSAPVAIEVFDAEGTVAWLNDAQVRYLGLPSADVAIGHFNVLTDPVSVAQGLAENFAPAYAGEVVHRRNVQVDLGAFESQWQSSRRKPWFEELLIPVKAEDGSVLGVVALLHEVTERVLAEQRLVAAQRHESIVMLAGGIAHDFNNLLAAILGNASAARLLGAGPQVDEHLREIELASERASVLTRQLLAYAGKAELSRKRLDLSKLVREISQLLAASANGCAMRFDVRPESWVIGDEAQLQQVVMNLVTNAVEAMEPGLPGTIRLATTVVEADAPYLAEAFGATGCAPGTYVGLEVSDTGRGMPPEIVNRMFEPFFSTKKTGHGLGLAGILGVVQGHRGAIRVYSEPGKGTTVKLLLPAAKVAGVPVVEDSQRRASRTGTILVVEDEAAFAASRSACSPVRTTGCCSRPTANRRSRYSRLIETRSTWCCWTSPCRRSTGPRYFVGSGS